MISQPPMRDVLSAVCAASEQKACLRGQCGPKQEIIITADGRSVLFLPSFLRTSTLSEALSAKRGPACVSLHATLTPSPDIMIMWRGSASGRA